MIIIPQRYLLSSIGTRPKEPGGGGGGGEPSGVCYGSTTDVYANPFPTDDAFRRPIGSLANYAPAGHAETVAWLRYSSANLNLPPASPWGTSWSDGDPSLPLHTVRPRAGSPQTFAVQVRFPANWNTGIDKVGGVETDRAAVVYERPSAAYPVGRWHEFWRLDNLTGIDTWLAYNWHVRKGNEVGYAPIERGICASGISIVLTAVRGSEWNTPDSHCEHALGIACPSKATHGDRVHQIIGPTITWPASTMDTSGAKNLGLCPYGRLLGIPPQSRGGPDPNTLGLGTAGSVAWRLYWVLVNYGVFIIDQSNGNAFRADQYLTTATANAFRAAVGILYKHLRPILNVKSTDLTKGGGVALAPNCAWNRAATVVIQPVKWWADKWGDGSADLAKFLSNSQGAGNPKDSWPMYQLGLGVDGNGLLYRATKETKYLDRCLLYIENCISRSMVSNATNFPLSNYKDGYRGWIDLSHPINPHGEEQALYEFYMWRYVMQVLYFAQGQSGYASRLAAILAFTEANIWTKWWNRGGSNRPWLYRETIYMAAEVAMTALYLRVLASSATVRSQCETVLANIDHTGMAPFTKDGVKASMRGQLKAHPKNPDAWFVNGFWPSRNVREPYGCDRAHYDAFLTYVIAAIEQGYGDWSTTDINRFSLTAAQYWPSRGVYYKYLNQEGGLESSNGNYSDGTVGLAGFNVSFQKRVEDHVTAPNSAAGTQLYGRGALNAARLLKKL